MPANCSVYADGQKKVPRSCNCLTQDLHCHGCGDNIGYVVAKPCSLCLPPSDRRTPSCSPSTPPRVMASTHRFIFLSSRVTWEERLYVSGDQDVLRPSRRHQDCEDPSVPRLTLIREQVPEPGDALFWHQLLTKGSFRVDIRDKDGCRGSHRYRLSRKRITAAR